jgi:hypothetical protein
VAGGIAAKEKPRWHNGSTGRVRFVRKHAGHDTGSLVLAETLAGVTQACAARQESPARAFRDRGAAGCAINVTGGQHYGIATIARDAVGVTPAKKAALAQDGIPAGQGIGENDNDAGTVRPAYLLYRKPARPSSEPLV